VWDARAGTSVRSIYGVQIYGDALDFKEVSNRILTGSWRRTDQLQVLEKPPISHFSQKQC
jgi:hypothetical protein